MGEAGIFHHLADLLVLQAGGGEDVPHADDIPSGRRLEGRAERDVADVPPVKSIRRARKSRSRSGDRGASFGKARSQIRRRSSSLGAGNSMMKRILRTNASSMFLVKFEARMEIPS
jgi:hypothetical protein